MAATQNDVSYSKSKWCKAKHLEGHIATAVTAGGSAIKLVQKIVIECDCLYKQRLDALTSSISSTLLRRMSRCFSGF